MHLSFYIGQEFYWNNLSCMKCLTGIVKPKSEKSGLKKLALVGLHQGIIEFLWKKMRWLLEDFNRKWNIDDFCKTKCLANLPICTTGE